jgi:hypothetical protein
MMIQRLVLNPVTAAATNAAITIDSVSTALVDPLMMANST